MGHKETNDCRVYTHSVTSLITRSIPPLPIIYRVLWHLYIDDFHGLICKNMIVYEIFSLLTQEAKILQKYDQLKMGRPDWCSTTGRLWPRWVGTRILPPTLDVCCWQRSHVFLYPRRGGRFWDVQHH